MSAEAAWKTYVKVGFALAPTVFFGLFYTMVNFPRAEAVLKKAGFLGTDPEPSTALFRFFITLSYFVFRNLDTLLSLMVLALIVLEIWVRPWATMRRRVCAVVAVLFNAFVLLGMTASTMTALLAASVLQRVK